MSSSGQSLLDIFFSSLFSFQAGRRLCNVIKHCALFLGRYSTVLSFVIKVGRKEGRSRNEQKRGKSVLFYQSWTSGLADSNLTVARIVPLPSPLAERPGPKRVAGYLAYYRLGKETVQGR